MATDMYSQGFGQYLKEQISENQIKSNPPQWRAGYRAAAKADAARSKVALKPEKVDRVDYTKCTISWALISSILHNPRFKNLINDSRLAPFVSLIKRAVWDQRDTISTYKQLNAAVNKQFDIILQWGFDENILTESDCEFHGYTASKK